MERAKSASRVWKSKFSSTAFLFVHATCTSVSSTSLALAPRNIALTSYSVGKLLVAALRHPEASRNRALKVNSFTATPNQVVAEFERQTGGQKWDVEYVPRDEVLQSEKKAHEEGDPFATAHTLRRIWADGSTLYDKRDNGDIGFEGKEESLESQVKKAVEKQMHA